MCRRPLALSLVLAIVAGAAPAALGSIARALDLAELVASAERIVVADVVSVESAWDRAHRNVHTTVELAVRESWKGDVPSSGRLTLRQLGGTVGEIEMSVLGAASFAPGERALLFLRRQGLVGMAQGKRAVRWETAGRRWLVEPAERAGATLVDGRGQPRPQLPPSESLTSLRSRVKLLVGE